MKRLPVWAMVVALGTTGCAVHDSKVDESRVQTPQLFVETEPVHALAPQLRSQWSEDRWWQSFDDPVLEELMDDMFSGNLDLELAVSRLEQLRATTRLAVAAQRPTVDGRGQAGRDHQPGIVEDADTDDYRLSLAAAYELDLWHRLDSRARAAALEEAATREDLQALYLSLSAQLADLYYLAVEQRSQIRLTGETIASYEDALIRVERRYRAGLVPVLDLYQARQTLATARTRLPVFQATLAQARHAMATLLGRFPDRETGGALETLPVPPEIPAPGVPAELLTRRPDVRAGFRRLESADARVAAAVADRFPKLTLSAGLGVSRTKFEMGTASGLFWNLLAGLLQPVVDGGRRKAEVDRTQAVFQEAATRYRKAVVEAIREVEDALSDNRHTEWRIERLAERVSAAEGTLRAAMDRYKLGLSDYLPVPTAQITLFDSRSLLLAARRRLISDRISLVRALGGRWMERQLHERLAASEPE